MERVTGSQHSDNRHQGSKRSMSSDLTEEFNEQVRRKYNIPDMESYLNMDYRERNNMFYEVIKHFKICVVPSQKIESFDHLPHFMIIEDNLKLIK